MGDINLANKRVYSFPVENPIFGEPKKLRVAEVFEL